MTRKNMISVTTKHLKNYLEIFITEQLQQIKQKENKMNLIQSFKKV